MIECKVMDAIKAEQTKKGKSLRNDRILGFPVLSLKKTKAFHLKIFQKKR
jgi:hypothetical protein